MSDGSYYDDYPVTVTVSNLAWLPDPYNVGGVALYVGVQTPYTDGTGTWTVHVYNDQQTYIGYFNGIIDGNGYLSYPGNPGVGFSFGNTDAAGNQNASTSYSMVFSADAAHPLSTNPPYTFTNKLVVEVPWNFPTTATVCFMDVFGDGKPFAQTEETTMMQAVAAIEDPYHPLTVGDTINVYQVGLNGDWTNLFNNGLAYFACRDFVYFGHGTATTLGSGTTTISAENVSSWLQNNSTLGTDRNPLDGGTYHPYRFVFLDGCQTAGGDWPLAFGIPKQTGLKITDFTDKRGIRPRAFMGWNKKKQIGWVGEGTMNDDHATYISTFWSTWAGTDTNGLLNTIKNSIKQAGIEYNPNNGTYHSNPQSSGMVLYGAEDLTIAQ